MTSLPITYHQPPNPSHNLQHVFKFRITDASPKFPELADFQRVYEEKELIEAENEARERKKIQKPPGRRISDFAQQMKEEKEPLNHYDREAIIAVEQGGQEYLCSVTSNAFRVDEVDPNAIVHSRKKPVPQFVQFVAVVRSDSIQLTPVTGNVYEAKRRPSTSGRRNLDRRQYDGEREKKVGNEMLRLLGAHRKLEVYDKEANKYSAFGSAEDISENNLDDIHRRIEIDTNDLDLDPGQGMDDAGFEPINADILEDQARDEAAVEGINMDVDGELDKFLSNPDDMEADASMKKGDDKKGVKKKIRADLPGAIEAKLRAGSLSKEQAKKWMKQLLDEFDVNMEQLKQQLEELTEYRGQDDSKELMLKQKVAVASVAKKQRK
jgi:hypothetical protein